MSGVLLDTCALIWIMNGDKIDEEALAAVEFAARNKQLFVSPISAWEVATLTAKGRLSLTMDPADWFDRALACAGMNLAPMPPATLIASAFLPADPPRDPADRIIIATARRENLKIVTRDLLILDYGALGNARILRC